MTRPALLAGALLVLAGCVNQRTPVMVDPFSRELPPPIAVFSIDYWHKLVEPSTMEFVPREFASPALDPASGRMVVGTRDGVLRSISIEGRVRWAIPTPSPFFAGVLIRDGVVYVPGGDGILRALRADTGAQLWTYDCGEELVTIAVLAEGKILVASQSATLFAINAAGGRAPRWCATAWSTWASRTGTPRRSTRRAARRSGIGSSRPARSSST